MRVIGGIQAGPDHIVHPTYTREASTLRFTSRRPNMFNLPRPGQDPEAIESLVRGMFVAPEGWELFARDYAGIEAVLVGVEAGSAIYTRLARLGVHSWVCAYLLNANGKLPASDLPDLSWSDQDLSDYFDAIKKKWPLEREASKRCVHAGNYLATAGKLYEEYPQYFPPRRDPLNPKKKPGKSSGAAWFLRFYFDLFPEIPRWHERLCRQVDKTTVARNAFGYVHRFYRVLEWQFDKKTKEWVWSYGDDAKRLVAFVPQSNAAGVISEAILELRQRAPETADTLRVPTYDELLGMARAKDVERHLAVLKEVMEAPIKQLPLPEEWGLGEWLTIRTEGKRGSCWGSMTKAA